MTLVGEEQTFWGTRWHQGGQVHSRAQEAVKCTEYQAQGREGRSYQREEVGAPEFALLPSLCFGCFCLVYTFLGFRMEQESGESEVTPTRPGSWKLLVFRGVVWAWEGGDARGWAKI